MKAKRQLFKAMILLIGMIAFAACSEKEEDTKPVGSSSLQVTPGKLSFSAAGGTQTLTVRTTYKYFGYDFTADWLQGDFKDDPTYNYITITADPNTTPAARTAHSARTLGENKEACHTSVRKRCDINAIQDPPLRVLNCLLICNFSFSQSLLSGRLLPGDVQPSSHPLQEEVVLDRYLCLQACP